MAKITITVESVEAKATLKALADRSENLSAVLQNIGVGIVERAKRRFGTSTDPEGVKWKDNAPATAKAKGGSVKVRHRTNAKGDLLRSAIMNGKGLIFAKTSHKRAIEREFSVGAHTITIPARPFMPIRPDGTLYLQEEADVLQALNEYLMGRT